MISIKDAIESGSGFHVTRRVTRYDVEWGVPTGVVTYRKFIQSLIPAYYYKFKDFTNSGHRTDATLTNPVGAPTLVAAHVDTSDFAAEYNGTKYSQSSASVAETTIRENGYSLVAWFKYTTGKTGDQTIVSKASVAGNPNVNITVGVGNNDFPYLLFASGVRRTLGIKANLSDWNSLIVCVIPSGADWKLSCYLNGVLVYGDVSAAYAPSNSDTSPMYIATARNSGGSFVNKWVGQLDEISLHMFGFNKETAVTIHNLGYQNTYLDPSQEFDTTGVNLSEQTPAQYKDTVLSTSPLDYYKFDALVSGTTVVNEMAGRQSMVFGSGTSAVQTSAINPRAETVTGYSKGLANNAAGTGQVNNFTIGTPTRQGIYGAFSMSMWFKPFAFGSTGGGPLAPINSIFRLFGKRAANPNFEELFSLVERGGYLDVYKGSNQITNTNSAVSQMTVNQWTHVAVTITDDGQLAIYINGTLALTTTNFLIDATYPQYRYSLGPNTNQITGDDCAVDELATYSKALTSGEVSKLFRVGKYGSFYSYTFNGVPIIDGGAPYRLSQSEYSVLQNEEDVTKYVDPSYAVERDISNVIETLTLNIYPGEENPTDVMRKFRANTYIKIEHRLHNVETGYDSGWVSLGHFLSDGVPAESYSAIEGRSVVTVVLRGLMKLLTLDACVDRFEPDKVYYSKMQLTGPQDFGDYLQFEAPDINNPGAPLYNIAPYPKPTIYVTEFSNMGDEANGGPFSANEVIPIKGANGSVRVQGGSGAFQFDSDYFADKFSENGIGNPQKVYAEFHKWVTPQDVDDNVAITSIKFNKDRWYIETSRLQSFADGKTVTFKSGLAKGKRFKAVQYGATNNLVSSGNQGEFGDYRNAARAGSTGSWSASGDAWRWAFNVPSGASVINSSFLNAYTFTLPNLLTSLTVDDVPRTAKLKGIEVTVRRKTDVGSSTDSDANRPVSDLEVRISKNGTQAVPAWSANRARPGQWIASTDYLDVVYGNELDTWGLGTPTVGELNTWLSGMQVFFAVQAKGSSTYATQAKVVDVDSIKVTLYFEDYQLIVLLDANGYMVNPRAEGVVEGDVVTIGDYNAPDTVMRRILASRGFQEVDPTKPFYMDLEPCPIELAASVEPLITTIEDAQTHLEVLELIRGYAPPDYRLYVDNTGVVRGRLIGLTADRPVDYELDAVVDINSDTSDFGIATRIIVTGQSTDRINVGKGVTGGGTAAIRAYQLNGYADTRTSATGKSLTQSAADAYVAQVFDGNAKTPLPTGASWNYGSPSINRHYGVILSKFGSQGSVKRWDFSNIPLCAVDIGRSANGTQISIEEFEMVHFNHFYEVGSNPINQTMKIYYMSESDYTADNGKLPPESPSQDNTDYFPRATDKGWKLLVDEFTVKEGENTISSSDFVEQKPVKARFIRFDVVQAHFRYPIQGGDSNACARVVLSEIKIYTSQRIYATAELGVDGEFGTPYYRELNTRLRRRTSVEPENLYIDTYDKAKSHAANLLRERYIDFTPYSANVYHPFVSAGDRVSLINPATGLRKRYLVIASASVSDLSTRLQLVDYDIVEN
jgi:hypothetical protein